MEKVEDMSGRRVEWGRGENYERAGDRGGEGKGGGCTGRGALGARGGRKVGGIGREGGDTVDGEG